jgi:hypothetical protein
MSSPLGLHGRELSTASLSSQSSSSNAENPTGSAYVSWTLSSLDYFTSNGRSSTTQKRRNRYSASSLSSSFSGSLGLITGSKKSQDQLQELKDPNESETQLQLSNISLAQLSSSQKSK